MFFFLVKYFFLFSRKKKCIAGLLKLDRVLLSLAFNLRLNLYPPEKGSEQNYHITFILCSQNTFLHSAFLLIHY